MKINGVFFKFFVLFVMVGFAYAQTTIGTVAGNITKTFGAVTNLLTASAYVGGVLFFAVAIFQFKAHKENPTQIPLSKPMVTLAMATALIFLPTMTNVAKGTFFGATAKIAGPTGTTIGN